MAFNIFLSCFFKEKNFNLVPEILTPKKNHTISSFPSAILEVILSKLPSYNLPNCRLVCKEWNNLILASKFESQMSIYSLLFVDKGTSDNFHGMNFDTKHLKMVRSVASFNFHPKLSTRDRVISIVNYCNGLFCLLIKKLNRCVDTSRAICLINPMTNEFFELPILKSDRSETYYYGLGFSPKTKQYKLVRTRTIYKNGMIEIFAFGTTPKWTTLDFSPMNDSVTDIVYFNGGLYLKGRVVTYRLDVEEERIKEIPNPNENELGWFSQIVELNDSLYLTFRCNDYHFHVWKMMEDLSWIKVFIFQVGSINSIDFKILEASEDGKILGIYRDFGCSFVLYRYDPMSETKETLVVQDPKIKKIRSFRIGSPNFNSLDKILAGKD